MSLSNDRKTIGRKINRFRYEQSIINESDRIELRIQLSEVFQVVTDAVLK